MYVYNKTDIGDIDNELSTLILNTYNEHEIGAFFTYYHNIEYLNTQLDLNANGLNTYTKGEVDDIITLLDIPSMLNLINNIDINKIDILMSDIEIIIVLSKTEAQTNYFDKNHITSNYYDKVAMGSMIFQKLI